MQEVRVQLYFGVPAERVFDAVSDHETFLSDRMTTTRIVHGGSDTRNGLGCIREVKIRRGPRMREEITHWERPSRFDYVIRAISFPARHEVGSLTFTPRSGGTHVEWTTRFEVPVPVVGRMLEKTLSAVFTRAFTSFLVAARTRLEEG